MRTTKLWAFWRRTQYVSGIGAIFVVVLVGAYYALIYEPASCFDDAQNGDERGVDCGGGCTRICAFDVMPPEILWARAFEITESQYNAVAYIENRNVGVGSPEVPYTFSLYDEQGLITQRSGVTTVPPDSVYPIFEGRIDTMNRTPTQTFIELDEAELWLPADAGREQFVVEDRTLSSVDVSPRLTAQVRNTALEDTRDVEVVATIFDSQGTALTSSRTFVERLPGRTTEDIVFTWPNPIAKTLRSCEVPTDVLLGIDLSGSMNDDGGVPPEPITSVLSAAAAFVERLKSHDQVGVVTFASEAATVQTLTRNTSAAGGVVSTLSIPPSEETGSTNTGDAIKRAEAELNSGRHNDNARKVLVLLTDGLANAPGEEPEQYALDAANSIKETGVEVFTIGLGENVNEAFLRNVASGAEYYHQAASVGTVDRIYRDITGAICEDGPAVIDIIPKTGASFAPLR